MRLALYIVGLSLLLPAPAFSGKFGQKVFKKYIEVTRKWSISRGKGVAADLCKDRNAYSGLSQKEKKNLSVYWHFSKSDTPYCGLTLALQDADPEMRQRAAFILSQNCNWENDDAVIELARKKHMGWMLIYALGECRKQRATPMLLELVSDPQPNVADSVVEALGKIGDASAIPALMASVKSEQINVRGKAALALARLGEKTLSRQVAKELLDAPEAKGDGRLEQMHAKDAASHVYEYVGEENDIPYLRQLRKQSSEQSVAAARGIINIMVRSNMQFKDWADTPQNKAIGIVSLPGGENCWLGKESFFRESIKPLETIVGLSYREIFRKYANDADDKVATLFIANAKYSMPKKEAELILSEVVASTKSDYVLNLAKDRLRQVSECQLME
ncbi:MAG: HEAT repeat domain-containing protein [Elusimicrobiales bacterium]